MKHVKQMMFVSLVAGLIALGSYTISTAGGPYGSVSGYKCVTLIAPGTCATTGSSLCKSAYDDTGTCATAIGSCVFCDTPDGLSSNTCVREEHPECWLDGQAAKDCDDSIVYRGTCAMVSGQCQCHQYWNVGPCSGWYYYGCIKP